MADNPSIGVDALFVPNFGPGTAKERDLFAAVGSALSTWTLLEWQLALVHLVVTHPEGRAPLGAFASYSSVTSVQARIRMIDTALHYTLNAGKADDVAIIEGWSGISSKLKKKAMSRHELAHGVVEGEKDGKGPYWIPFANHAGLIALDGRELFSFHDALKALKRMSAADVERRDRGFQSLHDELLEFRKSRLFPVMNKPHLDEKRRQTPDSGQK